MAEPEPLALLFGDFDPPRAVGQNAFEGVGLPGRPRLRRFVDPILLLAFGNDKDTNQASNDAQGDQKHGQAYEPAHRLGFDRVRFVHAVG